MPGHGQCLRCGGFREYIMTVNQRDIYYCAYCELETTISVDLETYQTRLNDEAGQ